MIFVCAEISDSSIGHHFYTNIDQTSDLIWRQFKWVSSKAAAFLGTKLPDFSLDAFIAIQKSQEQDIYSTKQCLFSFPVVHGV